MFWNKKGGKKNEAKAMETVGAGGSNAQGAPSPAPAPASAAPPPAQANTTQASTTRARTAPPAQRPQAANGAGGEHKTAVSAASLPASLNSKLAPSFGKLVSVLMTSPAHKSMTLEQVSARIVPALAHNQFVVAEAKPQGRDVTAPVGLVLWARVSDDIDRRMTSAASAELPIGTNDWASGENYWIIETVGGQAVVESMLSQLIKGPFAGKRFKLRQRDDQGRYVTQAYDA